MATRAPTYIRNGTPNFEDAPSRDRQRLVSVQPLTYNGSDPVEIELPIPDEDTVNIQIRITIGGVDDATLLVGEGDTDGILLQGLTTAPQRTIWLRIQDAPRFLVSGSGGDFRVEVYAR